MEEKDIKVEQARVISNKAVAYKTFELKLGYLHPEKFSPPGDFFPGQFLCLAPLDPQSVMARPFSIFKIDHGPQERSFSILYKVVGKNTELMSKLQPEETITFWGPLGRPLSFDMVNPHHYQKIWLVAGGMGISFLYFCFEEFLWLSCEPKVSHGVTFLYGNKTIEEIVPLLKYASWFKEKTLFSTNDGSFQHQGLVTDLLQEQIEQNYGVKAFVLCCGPQKMMQKTAEICQQHNLECFVSLEGIMACGLNNCKGCSIKTMSGMKSVCHDGPVFRGEEIIWDELG